MFYDKITAVEIENSSICNAACPQCLRENYPGDHSRFEETYLKNDFFENRIPEEIYLDLKEILLSGTLGDPCSAPNILDVCKIIKKRSPNSNLTIATNGGMKTTKFWKQLAEILTENDKVVFGIDGLKDTNYIHRVNVKWDKVINNAKSYIDAGGQAYWQYIVFNHNEHQIEEAKNLAELLGFKNFYTKKTHRFFLDEITGIERIGGNGQKLKPPTSAEYKNIIFYKTSFQKKSINDILKNSNGSKVTCVAKSERSMFIDHKGRLFPCCFLGANPLARNRLGTITDKWDFIWNNYGDEKINLHQHSWLEIMSSKFWKEIEQSWNENFPNQLISCIGTCSNSKERFNNVRDPRIS